MNKRKNILITGAAGTVGIEVVKQLINKDKYNITAFDVNSPNVQRKLNLYKNKISIVYGNITNETDLVKVGANQDVVIHLAAVIPPLADDNPTLSHQVNVVGTQNLIRQLEQHSPHAFLLYSSSISVYGDRLYTPMIAVNDAIIPSDRDEYAKTKIIAEDSIRNSMLDWSIFRLGAIMGGHKISKLMFHQPLDTSLEIATPSDTARAFVNAINHQTQLSKRIFNLGGGENCRMIYADFLSTSFKIFGLGKLNFHKKSFAEKNFHCGYYDDGYILNDILHFQKDTLATYFKSEEEKVSPLKKFFISMFKSPIKWYLQKQSEPLKAYFKKDVKTMRHYFNETN